MEITFLDGCYGTPNTGYTVEATASAFLDTVANEAEVESVECKNEAEKKAGEGFILGQFRPGAVAKSIKALRPDSATELFCFDVDDMTPEEVDLARPLWEQHSGALYTTFKHTAKAPRFRLLFELTEPVPTVHKEPFTTLYLNAAAMLGIKADPHAIDRVRFFIGPQHHPDRAKERERRRFTGAPLDVRQLAEVKGTSKVIQDASFDVAQDRPSRQDLRKLEARWRRGNSRLKKLAGALAAIIREEAFAPDGSIHNTSMEVAFELVREYRNLDAEWFAQTYLKICWESMGTLDYSGKLPDWVACVDSAKAKHCESEAEQTEAAGIRAAGTGALTAVEIDRAKALKGKLVMSCRGAMYVYCPRDDMYKGPFTAGELAVAVRDLLGGVPGVSESYFGRGGLVIKNAVQLIHEYGTTADSVMYWAKKPPKPYDPEGNTLYLQAYKWMDWAPVRHQIVEDLFEAIAPEPEKRGQLEAYFSQFRNLDQPLPALTLIGPKGCWKSQLCEIPSMFWTTKHGRNAGIASKILTRFNEHLLINPVIWSDEQLALTDHGKPQPEAYRATITGKTQTIELKGVSRVAVLKSAVRHTIAVNNDDKVFSSEVDSDSIMATMERFLLFYIDGGRIADFEARWAGTDEMAALRDGGPLLEHIRWIEENKTFKSSGRLFVVPNTEPQVLLRARFNDDTLLYIWQVAIEALENETKINGLNQLARLPLILNKDGKLYLSPKRVENLWHISRCTKGSSIKKPTAAKIARILAQAGFKANKDERVVTNRFKGWEVDLNTLNSFLQVSETIDIEQLAENLKKFIV